ncbi:MAG TPA: YgjV family protein [Propionibacteriaceae bacterium]|nr:YgjV family protein [Propionibacteriaceae bacterium]
MPISAVELLGYFASIAIVASLAMKSVVRLRILSFIGSVAFMTYGLLIGSYPLALTNGIAALLNVYYLRKEFARDRDLDAVPIELDAPFMRDFLRAHASDIAKFSHGFTARPTDTFGLLLMRDGLPAGTVIGTPEGTDLNLSLDYVTPAFRDSRLGTWLYAGPGASALTSAGFTKVIVEKPHHEALGYLRGVGFTEGADGSMVRTLS